MHFSRTISIAAIASLLFVPVVASAQSAPQSPAAGAVQSHGHHGHRGRFMRALHSLNLSAQQKQQIDDFVKATRQANQNADPATKKANAAKLRQNVEGVLTPAQRTQLQTQLRSQGAEQREGAEQAPPPRG